MLLGMRPPVLSDHIAASSSRTQADTTAALAASAGASRRLDRGEVVGEEEVRSADLEHVPLSSILSASLPWLRNY